MSARLIQTVLFTILVNAGGIAPATGTAPSIDVLAGTGNPMGQRAYSHRRGGALRCVIGLLLLLGVLYGVQATERERTMVRLWIETGAPYAGIGSGMVGGYAENIIDRRDLSWP